MRLPNLDQFFYRAVKLDLALEEISGDGREKCDQA